MHAHESTVGLDSCSTKAYVAPSYPQIYQEPVPGMSALLARLQGSLLAMPNNVTGGGSHSRPVPVAGKTLSSPSRVKFSTVGLQHPRLQRKQLLLDSFKRLATSSEEEQELQAWYSDDASDKPLMYEHESVVMFVPPDSCGNQWQHMYM